MGQGLHSLQARAVLINAGQANAATAHAVLINVGQANAAMGEAGYQDVIDCVENLAKLLKLEPEDVLVESTGVIGQRIKKGALLNSLPTLLNSLSSSVEGLLPWSHGHLADIRNWIRNIEQHASDNVNKILVGNKADMDEIKRVVPTSKGQALADEYGIKFFETSAKTNLNVEEVFFSIARDIKKRLADRDSRVEVFI
ncbi:hypothetical protein RIF29_39965 [Crotalaria pallida]|uniref:Uncharacterized protein n=1 Tax=Crotalaria pallida TaxID=3830 RepID=A0AAN9HN01_CROPI